MLNKLIYKLTKITVDDYIDDSNNLQIQCYSSNFGYFDLKQTAETFIKKHNHDDNCFFILESYIFNPTHSGQAIDILAERCYDSKACLICDCSTYHFLVNYKELNSQETIIFKGRDDNRIKKDTLAWFYDKHDNILQKCEVSEIPFTTTQCKEYDNLEWYDDSYLVYPLPKPLDNSDNHQHIISCYMFDDDFIQSLIKAKN